MAVIVVARRFQGLAGIGQGGYLAGLLAGRREGAFAVDFRQPIPLETPIEIETIGDRVIGSHQGRVIIEGRPAPEPGDPPPFVDLERAGRARGAAEADFLAPTQECFSCGNRPGNLAIHAGPVDHDLYATPYLPPDWTAQPDGMLAPSFVWAPVDCASGWRTCWERPRRLGVTGWMALQQVLPVRAGEPHVIVATAGPVWKARKRRSAAALYRADGTLCARADSLWIALPDTAG